MTEQQDRADILDLHKRWWMANFELDVPLMQTVFPAGVGNLMLHNNNGHPYFSREQLVQLWEWSGRKLEAKPDPVIWRVDISGGLAYIAGETYYRLPEREIHVIRFTEVYRRDDGEGNPEWKMWYFHASTAASLGVIRPPFDDSYHERGVGSLPHTTGLRVLSDWAAS